MKIAGLGIRQTKEVYSSIELAGAMPWSDNSRTYLRNRN